MPDHILRNLQRRLTMNSWSKGIMVASAVASLVLSGSMVARATDKAGAEPVHCAGINECKGKGSCAGAENACKAQNECKGKGWAEASSEQECIEKGGKVVAQKN
jgi:uncharacterized membrane protein